MNKLVLTLILVFTFIAIFIFSCKKEENPKTVATIGSFEITEISATGIVCETTIKADGNDVIIKKGVCWTTKNMPLLSGSSTNEGGGSGDFSSTVEGLVQTGVYHVRPYAINSTGIKYGEILEFQTLEGDGKQVIDYAGNIYNTVVIGNQTWLTYNSKYKYYKNSNAVYSVKSDIDLNPLFDMAIQTLKGIKDIHYYGEMYNWNDLDNEKICPRGWHSANMDDWNELIEYLGGSEVAASKLKEKGNKHWHIPNSDATNESGFYALPGGFQTLGATYDVGIYGFWWTGMEYDTSNAVAVHMRYDEPKVYSFIANKNYRLSVRCIKD